MCSVSLWGCLIPDSLLLEVFDNLGVQSLCVAAQVCRSWRRVAGDDPLWQRIARRTWRIPGPISPGCHSWQEEVKRLLYHVPCVQSEHYKDAHSDEVLDVTVSHNGHYFCTTSKDAAVILWRLGFPSSQVVKVDTAALFSWTLTQYSQFNDSDTLVLVCGVKLPAEAALFDMQSVSIGYAAVFSVPDLVPMYVVPMDPPTLFGAWLTHDIFVGGDIRGLQGTVKIQAHQVPKQPLVLDGEPDTIVNCNPVTLFNFQGHKHHQMSLFVATIPQQEEVVSPGNQLSESSSLYSAASSDYSMKPDDCISSNSTSKTKSLPGRKCRNCLSDKNVSTCRKHVKSTQERRYNKVHVHANELMKSDVKGDRDSLAVVGHAVLESSHGDMASPSSRGIPTCANCNQALTEPSDLESAQDLWSCTSCDASRPNITDDDFTVRGEHTGIPGSQFVTDNNSEIQLKKFKVDNNYATNCDSKSSHCQGAQTMVTDDGTSTPSVLCSMVEHSASSTSTAASVVNYKQCILFVTGAHDAIAAQVITRHKLTSVAQDLAAGGVREEDLDVNGRPRLHAKDHYFFFKNVYITGLCLSHDHRQAYFNYRELDRTAEGQQNDSGSELEENPDRDVSYKTFCDNLKVGVIDLVTMTHVKDVVYTGHTGCSSYPAWYICLGASPDYIGSGSEDACGYLWDRHYRMNIAQLRHQFGVVNGIAFSPVDQEVCVSVCDDQSIVVWRSLNWLNNSKQLEKQKM